MTTQPAPFDLESVVRERFEPIILAEVQRLVEIGEAARLAAIQSALGLAAESAPPPVMEGTGRTKKPHPVSVYWSQFTAEERSAILRQRRRKGLQKKAAAPPRSEVILFPKPITHRLRVVDLFCGAGGSTVGWAEAGHDVVLGVDNAKAALATYRANHGHDAIKLDLGEVGKAARLITGYRPDIIVGSPPCTDFSSAGRRIEGPAADLTRSFAEIVAKVRPRMFVLENVAQVRRSRAYADARAILARGGYGLTEAILDASRCGVPQRRRRLFLVGMLGAEDGWADLTGGLDAAPLSLKTAFGKDFPSHHYRHPCNSVRRAIFSAEHPSPTIRGTNRPMPRSYPGRAGDSVSPEGVRALTAAERAAIQTFPSDYLWRGTTTEIELQIGNAVPPKMAALVAESVLSAWASCIESESRALAA